MVADDSYIDPAHGNWADPESEALIAENLVQGIKDRDPEAEENLIRRYSKKLWAMLRRKTRDDFLTDDLHQETFGLVLEKARADQIRQPKKLLGYIYRVAGYLFIMARRGSARMELDGGDAALKVQDQGPDAQTRMEQEEEAAIVRQVIQELHSTRDREILFRFYIREEDRARIRADLGLEAAHFNRVLFKARHRFKELWIRHGESRGAGRSPGPSTTSQGGPF